MSGISQYFHGECGEVTDLCWVPRGDSLFYMMSLQNDPHRTTARDYGSDIGIDPDIRCGHQVVYLRADSYCGIWVPAESQYHPEFDLAVDRVIKNRQYMEEFRQLARSPGGRVQRWLDSLAEQTSVRVRGSGPNEQLFEEDTIPATVFLSFRSRSILIARMLREFLSSEAKMDVWFAPEHQEEIEWHVDEFLAKWLEDSVSKCQIFVLLLTQEALNSEWVLKEIDWAKDKAESGRGFHLVALKMEDVPIPDLGGGEKYVVDCSGLSVGEILEELYASVHRRQGRRDWLEEQRRRGWPGYVEPATGYDHLASDAGKAVSLRLFKKDAEICWELDYTTEEGVVRRARGKGKRQIVDLGIRPGDKVGFFKSDIQYPLAIWMRSEDPDLRPSEVVNAYRHRIGEISSATTPNLAVVPNVLLSSIGHTTGFFLIVALGLLIGKFTFAPNASWWMIIGAWVAGGFTTMIFENAVFKKLVEESPTTWWWRTRLGLSASLLMITIACAAGIAFVAYVSGWRRISLKILLGAPILTVFVIHIVGYILDVRQQAIRSRPA